MIMDMTVTPITNVNYDEKRLLEPGFVAHFCFEPNQVVRVLNRNEQKEEVIHAKDISMWDNELIVNGVHYEVLRIFSK